MMKKYLQTLLLLSLLALGCEEETIEPELFGALSGTVVDDVNGKPVANASVSTNPVTTTVTTDATGKFEFASIQTGTYALRVEKTGYTLEIETVVIEEDKTTGVNVRLRADSLNNNLPVAPALVSPSNSAVNQSVTLNFKWRKASDSDVGESLKYSVLLFAAGASQADTLVHQTADTTATATNLKYGTEYFWQVLVYDKSDNPVFGQVWSFKTVAPPDNRILFARKENGKYDIWSANTAGAQQVKLTSGGSNNWRPRYRPDRKRIAFLSDQNIDPQLFVMNSDGTGATQVTSVPVAGASILDLDFCWRPDGAELLYMNNSRLYRIRPDGSGLTLFATAPAGFTFQEVDWNGTTKRIQARVVGAFLYESRILEYSEAGTLIGTVIADNPGGQQGPAFFPDGNRIVYTEDDLGFNSPDGRQLDASLKVRNALTGTVSDFSANKIPGTNDLDPRFSPDGSKVIFVNTNNDGVSPRSIWTADGSIVISGRVKLIDNAEMPDWR